MTFHDHLVSYLALYPETVLICVPLGYLVAAQPDPAGVTVEEHDAYYSEYRDAAGEVLARVVWPE